MNYAIQIALFTELSILTALSVDFLYRDVGILSFAQAAFVGLGAYIFAILETRTHAGPWISVVIALAATSMISGITATLYAGVQQDFIILGTVGVQLSLYGMFQNWTSLTQGASGIANIPLMSLGGLVIDTPRRCLILSSIAMAGGTAVIVALRRTRWHSVLRCIRGNEAFAASIGIAVGREKRRAAAISGLLAAAAGVLYAINVRFVDASSFTIIDSTLVVGVAMLSAAGRFMPRPVFGAAIFCVLPELLRFMGAGTYAADLRQILFAFALVVSTFKQQVERSTP